MPPLPTVMSPGVGGSSGPPSPVVTVPGPPIAPSASSAVFQSNTCTVWSISPVMTTSLSPSGENWRATIEGYPSNGSCATRPLNSPVFGCTLLSHTHTMGGPAVLATWPVATRHVSGCIARHLMSSSCPWKKCCLWLCLS